MEPAVAIRPDLLTFDLLQDGFRFLRIIPKIRLKSNFLFFFYGFFLLIVVKDTSSRPRYAPSNP
jgi:hypothetical protein